MGEAAVKEPSMEDILSSIRKIISDEGSAPENEQPVAAEQVQEPEPQPEPEMAVEASPPPQMSEVLEEVRAEEPAPEAPSDNVSGNAAAQMAASLANIADSVKAEVPAEQDTSSQEVEAGPEPSVWDEVSEPVESTEASAPAEEVESETMIEPQEAAPSLASIAETVAEQVEIPAAPEPEPEPQVEQVHQELEAELNHVEMAEATPAPEPQISQTPAPQAVAPEISKASVETMVEEEMAFKGALMSPSSDGAVAGAFDRLKRSAMDDIDAKTEAILRPMLREWLDENLPNMVERLVREEIERVARGV